VRCGRGWVVIGGLCAAVLAVSSRGQTTGAALRRACDQLVATQLEVGVNAGAWPEETAFTGTMAAGLAWAYQRTCEPMYLQAAERAAGFISRVSGIYYGYGDDAWAMLLLSEASADRWDNPYRANLAAFYEGVREMEGGTAGFIASYGTGTEPSTAVLYLAMHCVASDYVGATDAEMFRAAVRDFLAGVDDATASWPVLALGAATWALAETGPLDGGLVDPSGTGRPMWNLVRLEDLPGMLLGHQVVEGPEGADGADAAIAGAFYWRFDHTDGGDGEGVVAGFTEDTVFGAMGLAAAARRWGDPVLGAASDRSLRVLVGVVSRGGASVGAEPGAGGVRGGIGRGAGDVGGGGGYEFGRRDRSGGCACAGVGVAGTVRRRVSMRGGGRERRRPSGSGGPGGDGVRMAGGGITTGDGGSWDAVLYEGHVGG